jgi:hypothetical protein
MRGGSDDTVTSSVIQAMSGPMREGLRSRYAVGGIAARRQGDDRGHVRFPVELL